LPAQQMSVLYQKNSGSLYPARFTSFKGFSYFAANTENDRELWRTDGTSEGTNLFKDLTVGSSGNPMFFIERDDVLYFFSGLDMATDVWLWKTDGTINGTVPVKFIGNKVWLIGPPVIVSNMIYFASGDNNRSLDLWRSDGSESGTVAFTKIANEGVVLNTTPFFATTGGVLYFPGYSAEFGTELWSSNGTSEGTKMVKDIYPGTESSYPDFLIEVNNVLHFSASSPSGSDIWRTNGTENGTSKAIKEGQGGIQRRCLFTIGSKLFLQSVTNGSCLLGATDTSGVVITLKEIGKTNGRQMIHQITEYHGLLFFEFRDFDGGTELWKSDGTEDGTIKISEFSSTGIPRLICKFMILDDKLYFMVLDYEVKSELWQTDGTAEGTFIVSTGPYIHEGYTWFNNEYDISSIKSYIIFSGYSSDFVAELWRAETKPEIISEVQEMELNTVGIQCYPNPVNNELSIHFNAHDEIKTVKIYDILGRLITDISDMKSDLSLNTSQYNSGYYFVVAVGATANYCSKFFKK